MDDAGECIECGRAVVEPGQKFCPACGQPTPVHRIDWHFLAHELEHSVLHMDRGILYSLKHLMLRPGHLMRAYLGGRRARQAKPLLLIMVMAAVVLLLTQHLASGDVMAGMMAGGAAGGDTLSASMAAASRSVNDWMNTYFAATTLALLPLEAAAFRLAFRRAGGLNYPEWLVVTAFLTVQTFVFWSAALLLQRWLPHVLAWSVLVSSAFGVFSLVQLFAPYPRWKAALRALLGYALFLLLSQLVVVAVVSALLIARMPQ